MNGKALIKIVIGVVVIGGSLTYFVFTAMQSSYAYYISVDEFASKQTMAQTHTLRIAGKVETGSISQDLEKIQLSFKLAGNTVSLPVLYEGSVPENFAEEREVVIEGRMDAEGTFQATRLMTKCESKYEAKLDEDEADPKTSKTPENNE